MAYGLFFSFSVFLVPLVEEFGWSRGLTAGALSLSTVVQGLLAPVTGMLVDRVGPRRVVLGGVVLLGSAPLLNATVHAPWHLYLYTGVLGAIGLVGLGWVPMGVLLSQWFVERRGRAVGVAFSGMGVGVFVIGPLTQALVTAVGWRTASATLGAGALCLLLPLVWWGAREPDVGEPRGEGLGASGVSSGRGLPLSATTLRASVVPSRGGPPVPAPDPSPRYALRTRAFWALFLAYFFTPLAVFPVSAHQVAFAIDLGIEPLVAATVFGLMGLMSSLGRPGFGLAADRFGGPLSATVSFACTACGALALLALETSARTTWLGVYAILFGLGFGARGPIITAMASDLFGGRRFGAIYGVLNLGNGLGAALGPWFAGFVHDVTGSYRIAFVASVVFCVFGAGCFWATGRRAS